jgi:hypothetical protein
MSTTTSNRCDKCRKKLGLLPYKCKCGKIFCMPHLHAEEHECTFDYKLEGKQLLNKQINVGSLEKKLDKI